ncbi:MAG: hypothetical protein HWE27_04910 [Gammaproteobacteria bacterium]|nr:hypothetical protein [Gammaproteobacteria bacterium]
MNRYLFLVLFVLILNESFAALPPKFQNMKDLDVMINFVKKHDRVLSTLRNIDLEKKVVYFGDQCKAQFKRISSPKPEGWVGPADPLKFDRANCSIE